MSNVKINDLTAASSATTSMQIETDDGTGTTSNKITTVQTLNLLNVARPFCANFVNSIVNLYDLELADKALYKSSWYTVQYCDLTYYKQVRLMVRVYIAGTANSKITLKYYAGYTLTYSAYADIGTSAVQVPLNATGIYYSNWIDLASAAKADVSILCGTTGGDGTTDPYISYLQAEFR